MSKLVISKHREQINVYSDELEGQDVLVLDWDNNMRPTPMSTLVDEDLIAHLVKVERHQACPTPNRLADYEQQIHLAHAIRNSPNTLNTILAGLRTLQLAIEKNALPAGIQESYYSGRNVPDPEQLDRLCEKLNS